MFRLLFFHYRLSQIKKYTHGAALIQQKQLKKLVCAAKNTSFGKAHRFNAIKGYKEFAEEVPLHEYDELKPYFERMMGGERNVLWHSEIKWFAKSSGTTNDKSKFIPVSNEALKECHYRGAADVLLIYRKNYPKQGLMKGKQLVLGGSNKVSNTKFGIRTGDLSSILLENAPVLTRIVRSPSPEVASMDEWEEKLRRIVKECASDNVVSLSGVPSWMMVMIKELLRDTGKKNLLEVWPKLELFIHGGISFEPYREQYEKLIPSDKMRYMETYNASEGFFAIQNDPTDASMLLMLDLGVFYEFIPMSEFGTPNARVLPIWEVEQEVNYAMVITTNGGLWRYVIGDTVRFTSTTPYKIKITGRTKQFVNAFGEELMVDNASKALAKTCLRTGAEIEEYSVAPVYATGEKQGYHQWLVEFSTEPASLEEFVQLLDEELKRVNSDYEAKRYKDMTLLPPQVIKARQKLFFDWLKSKGKLGGQNKVPRLSNGRQYMDSLLSMNQ